MSGVIGPQYQGGYTIPNPQRPPSDPQPRAVYGLRSTPPIFTVITRAGNGGPYGMPYLAFTASPRVRQTSAYLVYPRATGAVELSGLVHARAQGAPAVSPQLLVSALDHLRVLGSIAVSTPSVEPPVEPPVTPPVSPVTSPRTLRYVRRRNRPRERGS